MTKQERIEQIITNINGFKSESYFRNDLLKEYRKLEKQIVEEVFGKEHTREKFYNLTSVYKHINERALPYFKDVSGKLQNFNKLNFDITNEILKIISGEKGEYMTNKSLESLKCKNKVIRNIELKNHNRKVEIDFIVITQKAIFIIEVKNTKKNIKIDEKGNFYRVLNSEKFDSNIGEKMNDREYLLREFLKSKGIININIESLIVFTNSEINVENNYDYLNHCFLSNLPHIIKNYIGNTIYNLKEVETMYNSLSSLESITLYRPEINITEYINSFANILATIEELEFERNQEELRKQNSLLYKLKALFQKDNKYVKSA